MKKLSIIFILSCCAFSCTKNGNKQYSTWYINGEGFSSNEVSFESNKGGTYLKKGGSTNNFNLGWGLGMPLPGYVLVSADTTSNNPALFRVDFSKDGAYYRLSFYNPDSVLVSFANGKIRYEMPPAWFINYYDSKDSVLIKGIFNEP